MDAHLFDARQMCMQAVARQQNLLRNRLYVNKIILSNENLFATFYSAVEMLLTQCHMNLTWNRTSYTMTGWLWSFESESFWICNFFLDLICWKIFVRFFGRRFFGISRKAFGVFFMLVSFILFEILFLYFWN